MKINFWCGDKIIDGWLNVDAVPRGTNGRCPDMIHIMEFASNGEVLNPLPLADGSADVLQAIHALEHVYVWQAGPLILEWRRLLKPGGILVLELPNLIKCCENILSGRMRGGKHPDQLGMWGAYGDDRTKNPFMAHKYGWTPKTLTDFLSANGFTKIVEKPTVYHPAGRNFRDMRIEAVKA